MGNQLVADLKRIGKYGGCVVNLTTKRGKILHLIESVVEKGPKVREDKTGDIADPITLCPLDGERRVRPFPLSLCASLRKRTKAERRRRWNPTQAFEV